MEKKLYFISNVNQEACPAQIILSDVPTAVSEITSEEYIDYPTEEELAWEVGCAVDDDGDWIPLDDDD